MPAIDSCEPQIIRALQKAGWDVIDKTLPIQLEPKRVVYADLRLQHTRDGQQIIVVEIKCFLATRPLLDEFYHAVGQYLFYRDALTLRDIHIPIYLAIPAKIHQTLFQRLSVHTTVRNAKIKLIVVDLVTEEVVSWID